jgi:hypothetical protein
MPKKSTALKNWVDFLRARSWDAAYWQTPQLEVFASSGRPEKLFYFTRSAVLDAWLKHDLTVPSVVAFTRAGLVTETYSKLVRAMSASLGMPVEFVGSLTPGDVLTYLTLQHGGLDLASPKSGDSDVRYFGIDDEWLDIRDEYTSRRPVGLSLPQLLVPMSPEDEAELDILEKLVPSIETMLGPKSAAILRSRQMLFLEGMTNPKIYGDDFSPILRRHLMGK